MERPRSAVRKGRGEATSSSQTDHAGSSQAQSSPPAQKLDVPVLPTVNFCGCGSPRISSIHTAFRCSHPGSLRICWANSPASGIPAASNTQITGVSRASGVRPPSFRGPSTRSPGSSRARRSLRPSRGSGDV